MAYIDESNSLSKFPNEIDQFKVVYDLSNEQVALAKKLNELKAKDVLSSVEQQEVLDIQSQLRENIITAHDWNVFASAIWNMEVLLNGEIKDYIKEKQKEWDTYVDNFNNKGLWKRGTEYKAQNMVLLPSGDLFIALDDHVSSEANQPLPEQSTTYWAPISSRGKRGADGVAGNYKGFWNALTTYNLSDVVTHEDMGHDGGLMYISNTTNTNKAPHQSPSDWTLITRVMTSKNKPLKAQAGTHFIKILD